MKSFRYGFIFCLLFSLISRPALSQTIYTENFPPYNYQVDGKLLGLSSQIIQQMSRELGVQPVISFLPWTRAYKYAKERENSGIFSIVRIPTREDDFQWVGPIETVNIGIYTSEKNHTQYFGDNAHRLNQAKKVPSIGVQRGGAAERILTSMEFLNLDYSETTRKAILRLINNRYELLALDDNYLKFILEAENVPIDRVRRIADVGKFDLYLAFSNSTPKNVVSKWQLALDKIKQDQSINNERIVN